MAPLRCAEHNPTWSQQITDCASGPAANRGQSVGAQKPPNLFGTSAVGSRVRADAWFKLTIQILRLWVTPQTSISQPGLRRCLTCFDDNERK
jgi:hypothetical protein